MVPFIKLGNILSEMKNLFDECQRMYPDTQKRIYLLPFNNPSRDLDILKDYEDIVGSIDNWTSRSWYTSCFTPKNTNVAVWHKDASDISIEESETYFNVTCAYPIGTEFALRSDKNWTILTPNPGDLLLVNLSKVVHRTPPAAEGNPRFLLRLTNRRFTREVNSEATDIKQFRWKSRTVKTLKGTSPSLQDNEI